MLVVLPCVGLWVVGVGLLSTLEWKRLARSDLSAWLALSGAACSIKEHLPSKRSVSASSSLLMPQYVQSHVYFFIYVWLNIRPICEFIVCPYTQ